MKQHLVRYLLGGLLLLLLLGHAAKVYQLGFISHLDAILYDSKLRLTMPGGVDQRVVILDIDEKSLAEVGHWPWGRDKLATLVDSLFDQHGIALLGFDVVFAEPDGSSGLKTLEDIAGGELKGSGEFQTVLAGLRPRLDFDARFAAAIKGRPVILGFYFSDKSGGGGAGALPAPVLPAGSFQGRNIYFTQWTSYGANLPELQRNAAGAGHFNPRVDFDGMSRRVPMIAEYQGGYYESLSLAMVRALLGFPKVVPGYPEERFFSSKTYSDMEWLDLPTGRGSLPVPVDEDVATLIPYRGAQGSFPYVSAADVLAGRVQAGQLRDKIVLVGTTAPGLMDLRATPVGAAYPGVEIHANLIAGMMDGTIKHRPPYVLGADVLLLVLSGGVMILLLPLLSPLRASLVTLSVLSFLVSVNLAFWHFGQMVLPLAGGLLLVAILFAFNMSWGYFVESKAKRQFTELFGQYVPPELVDEMARNPENYTMDGRKAELTVLFSDIRGFTSISEGLQPDQLAALLNEYLGAMTEVVRQNRGTLDKYIGDAIMAFWGAPVDDSDHAKHAVLTAMQMQDRLAELNNTLVAKGWPELRIGIGINTGIMTVGDMGSPVRKAYTVLGDAVNLGSRIEGITKEYGVGIIVGAATREKLRQAVVFRELDRVRVKGKEEPVAVFEPVAIEGQPDERLSEELKLWQQFLRLYRAQDWERAEVTLLNLSRLTPRKLFDIYAERIAHYRRNPPGEAWDGVWAFDTK